MTLLNCCSLYCHRSLESVENDFYDVIIAVPVLREHPFAARERRKLARDPQPRLLMANGAILREETLADHHGIRRRGGVRRFPRRPTPREPD